MAITRQQKEKIIEDGMNDVKNSSVVLFADFKGTKVDEMKNLRMLLKNTGITYRVIKKRLMNIILKKEGIDFDVLGLDGQIGVAFAKGDISEVAQPVYKFSKEHETFKVVGGVDVNEKKEIPLETILAIGNLPSRETLITQVVGSIAAPLRGLMYVLKAKSEK